MRALLTVAAALAILAAASPTAPADDGSGGPDAAMAAGADAGSTDGESLLHPLKKLPDCPPAAPSGPHCVYLALKKPSKVAAEKLAKKLRTDGVASDVSDELQVSLSLSDAQLQELLGAKLSYAMTAASASNRMVCDAQVASFQAPPRYAEVASVRIDAQCP